MSMIQVRQVSFGIAWELYQYPKPTQGCFSGQKKRRKLKTQAWVLCNGLLIFPPRIWGFKNHIGTGNKVIVFCNVEELKLGGNVPSRYLEGVSTFKRPYIQDRKILGSSIRNQQGTVVMHYLTMEIHPEKRITGNFVMVPTSHSVINTG